MRISCKGTGLSSSTDSPGFAARRPGRLLRIAERAEDNPDATFIICSLMSSIRGNVAKVFGELYFLLEYRDEEMKR